MQFDHSKTNYQSQLQEKHQQTLREFADFGIEEVGVYPSPITAYRYRAEFGVWHQGSTLHYSMRDAADKTKVVLIEDFPIAAKVIQALMPKLLASIAGYHELSHKLFQIEFLATLGGDMIVTLIYHKRLDDIWQSHAQALANEFGINLIGRARKQKIVIGNDYVVERLAVERRTYAYRQIEGSFTQPNPKVCEHMLSWTLANATNLGGDLLELYCGNGNFTMPLAKKFRRVLATEISKTSIGAALVNCGLNEVTNIQFVRMSSEEFVQAWQGIRPFRRLRDIELNQFQFSTIFVDPPRAGLDDTTRELVTHFANIIYISCNPETLKRDLLAITATHTVADMALFDQFPYTPHRECGVLLKSKKINPVTDDVSI